MMMTFCNDLYLKIITEQNYISRASQSINDEFYPDIKKGFVPPIKVCL